MAGAFLFDIGNVIISFDFGIAARKLSPQCEVSPEKALSLVSELTPVLERGEMTVEVFLEEAIARVGFTGSTDEFRGAMEDIFTLNEPIVRFIEGVSEAGTPLFLLSNTNGIHVPFFENTYEVFSRFDGRIYSHEVGLMKPEPEIYALATSRFELNPSETVYIDDAPANCAAGREAGFITLQYEVSQHERFLSEVTPHL
ncbi:MAG: HAD family phosphatase [Verrucomicrobiota bacterium]